MSGSGIEAHCGAFSTGDRWCCARRRGERGLRTYNPRDSCLKDVTPAYEDLFGKETGAIVTRSSLQKARVVEAAVELGLTRTREKNPFFESACWILA